MEDLFDVSGKTALITGGSRGIGKMLARGLLERGVKVYISSRKTEICDAAAEELSAYGECISIPADVSKMPGIELLANELGQRENSLDILVNNAGRAWGAEFDEFPESGWDDIMDINVKTVFFLTQKLAPLLRASAAGGNLAKVINIASIDGLSNTDNETYSYSASKAGVIHLTRRMAKRLIAEDIVVSCIAPGAFRSDMNRVARDHADDMAKVIPAKRVGDAEDMIGAVVYLASRAGDYVVGSTLTVDGGVVFAR